jgi:hypothetical protein
LVLSKIKKKNALKRQKFADIPDIQGIMTLLSDNPENDFQDYFCQWHHLMKCMASQGEYFKDGSSYQCTVKRVHRAIPGIKLSRLVLMCIIVHKREKAFII